MVEPLRINVERPLLGCVQKVLSYTPSKRGYHLITTHVVEVLGSQLTEMQHGMCNIFVQDMSCSLTVNQNSWRPGRGFDREDVLVAQRIFDLADVPSDPESFAKSLSIPVTSGKLALGPMQGLYLCEHGDFETPKTSTIIITAYGQLATLVGGMRNRSSTRREREATLLSPALSPSHPLSLSLWLRLSSAAVLSNPACARRPRPSSRARSIPSIGGQRSPARRALALRTRGPTGTSRLTVDKRVGLSVTWAGSHLVHRPKRLDPQNFPPHTSLSRPSQSAIADDAHGGSQDSKLVGIGPRVAHTWRREAVFACATPKPPHGGHF